MYIHRTPQTGKSDWGELSYDRTRLRNLVEICMHVHIDLNTCTHVFLMSQPQLQDFYVCVA